MPPAVFFPKRFWSALVLLVFMPWGHLSAAGLDQNTAALGQSPRFVLFFRDLSRPFPMDICRVIHERGAIPLISVEPLQWGAPRGEYLAAIWFNLDKRREGEANWRIDADELSLQAWRETFARP